jgi:transposase-like protein
MNTCPYCHAQERQVKNGTNASGSQRWKCQVCGRKYTPEPHQQGYPDSLRQQAVKMSVDGLNYRRIGRLLGIDHKTVIYWVKAHTDQLPPAPMPHDLNNAELDELFTFVGKKKTSSTS